MRAALMARQFDVPGRLVSVQPHGAGNVNDTYLAIFRTTFSENRFILQRINPRVFPHPAHIMENMRVVTDHVHRRIKEEINFADRIWQLPKLMTARGGVDFVLDGEDRAWRAISLIASAASYPTVQSPEHAYEAGFVLGHFQRLISDIPPERLHDTLPGFHVTPQYLEKLDEALATNEGMERASASAGAEWCVDFIRKRRDWCSVLEDGRDTGQLELRPVHGDPKITNIMIDDATGKGTSIVDLDTVKPGLIHYDFGDCLRSCCNPAGEEAADLSSVLFDTDLCRAIVRGYMAQAHQFLSDEDRLFFFDALRLITFELGLRFFTDYLCDDVYFKIRYDGQNLHRARVQMKLVESIETQEVAIRKILGSY